MKKLLFIIFLIHSIIKTNNNIIKKTCIVPLSDAYPNRYFYHTPFQYNRYDSHKQLLCKGNCAIRYQKNYNEEEFASLLFDNPMISDNNNNNHYNAGVLGLGFSQDTYSKLNTKASRNSIFIDCTIEISRVSSPYYLHIGIPIQRTEQKITIDEKVFSDGKVIKGGFIEEYQINSTANLNDWQNTPSSIIHSLNSIKSYLSGESIGNHQEALFGKVTECPMTLWSLADLYIQIGYDAAVYKKLNFGYYLRGVIPTSPNLKTTWNKFLFFPTIGNVDRYECGIGFNGNINIKDNDSINQTIYIDFYGGYLFKNNQMRPFDLKNGFFSRYGPVKIFNQETLSYTNKTIWAVDITTINNSIGNCFKSELVLDFVYQYYQSFFNIGYSFKSQSQEKISCANNNLPQLIDRYIYGYSPQQYVQTPNPLNTNNNNWTSQLITPESSLKKIALTDISLFKNTQDTIIGVPISENNQLLKSSINYNSGLMSLQLLNIFFIGYSYEKLKTEYNTIFSIKGAISTTANQYYTPPFFEFLISLELDY